MTGKGLRIALAAALLVGCLGLAVRANAAVSMRGADALGSACAFVPTTGDWNNAANWSCGHVPTTSDQVSIGSGQTAQIGAAAHAGDLSLIGGIIQFTANVGLDVTAVAGQSNGSFGVSSGSITGTGSLTVAGHFSKTTVGQLTVSDTTLTLDDPAPTGSELAGGTICLNSAAATLHLTTPFGIATGADTNAFNCSAGHIRLDASAELDKTATGTVTINTPLDNQGVVRDESGTLNLNGGSVATDGGTYTADSAATLVFSAGNFTVAGGVGGLGTTQVSTNLTLTAAATFTPAVLHQTSGQFTVTGSSALSLPTFNFDNGAFSSSRNVTATNFNVQSGTLDGGLTLAATNFTKTTGGQLTINNATLEPDSDVTLNAGRICLNGGSALLHLQHLLTIATGADATVFNCSGGHIRLDGTAEIDKTSTDTITLNTPLDNQGTVRNEVGTLNLSGGSVATDNGSYTTDAGTTLDFNIGNYTIAGSLGGAGTVQVNTNVALGATATFTPATLHQTSGLLAIQGSSALSFPTYNLDGGNLTSSRNITAASFNVQSGVLDGGLTLTATSFTKTTIGQLTIDNATLAPQSDITFNAGTVCLNSQNALLHLQHLLTIANGADPTVLNCSSGRVRLDGTAEIDNTATGPITFNTPLDNQGTVRNESGTLNLNGGSVATDNGSYTTDAGTTLDFNAGTWAVAGSVGGLGTIQVNTNVTLGATAAFAPAALHQTSGVLTINGSTALSLPSYSLDAGNVTSSRNITATSFSVQSGTLDGGFTLTATTFTKTTAGQLTVDNATLAPQSDVSLAAGTICLNNPNALLHLQNTLTIPNGADPNVFNCSSGRIRLDQTAEIDKTATGTITLTTPLDNQGTVLDEAGTLNLNGGSVAADNGSYTASNGATLDFNVGTWTLAGTVGGAGTTAVNTNVTLAATANFTPATLHQTGGVLTVQGAGNVSLAAYNLDSGTVSSGRNITATAFNVQSGTVNGAFTLTVPQGGSFSKTTGGQLTTQGSMTLVLGVDATLAAGDICTTGTSVLELPHHFTIGAGADPSPFGCSAGAIQIDGAGVFDTAQATSTIQTPVQNAGTIAVGASQTLNLNGGMSQTAGTTTVAAGGTVGGATALQVSGGTVTVNGTVGNAITLTGTAALKGTGQTATVANISGTVAPGTSPGTLTIAGNYTQGAGGTLTEEIAGNTAAQFDRLLVSGNVTLGGTLAIQSGGFTPASTDTFKIIGGAATRTGTFATVTGASAPPSIYTVQYDADGVTLLVNGTAPTNTVAPSIPATGHPGDLVTCDPGTWTGSPTFTFVWTRDGTAIGGQTAASYTLVDADAGHMIRCTVTAHNAGGDSAPVDSNALTASPAAPANTAAPSIPGAGHTGDLVTCNPGTWSGSPTFTFVWTRDGTAIGGQTGATYTLTDADAGHTIRCSVTAHNGAGDAGPVDSNALSATVAAPANTAAPSIPTSGHTGDLVTCNVGSWTGSPSFAFAWTRDGATISGQTAQTYTLTDADATHAIRCRVTAHNGGGDAGPVDSNALTSAVLAPANTAAPTIPATGHSGESVTCAPGTWTGSPTFTFAWTLDGTVISGQTASTYTIVAADATHVVRCRVTAHNGGGDAGPVDSNALAATIALARNTGAPSIPGTGRPGDVVTCNPGTWTGSPTFTYKWLRNDVALAGQTARTYTVGANDVSQQLKCRVTAHNAGGDSAPVDSNALAVVKSSAAGPCVICIVGPTSRTNLTSTGSGSITALGGIQINGKASVSGRGKIKASSIGMFPRASKASNFTPKPVVLKHPVADPFAGRAAPSLAAACRTVPRSNASVTLQPGVYCGIARQSGKVSLKPGLYVFTGPINLGTKASLGGSGVTISLRGAHTSIGLSGHAVLDLTAPSTGPFRGIAVFFDRSDIGSLALSGSSSATLGGAIYGAKGSVRFSGGSALTVTGSPLVIGSLARTGSSRVLVRAGVF